jgi:hypothetical protein
LRAGEEDLLELGHSQARLILLVDLRYFEFVFGRSFADHTRTGAFSCDEPKMRTVNLVPLGYCASYSSSNRRPSRSTAQ